MIIILEGPDGTGKTTLAQEICKKLGAKYLHLTYRWKDKIFDYHTAAIRFASKQTQPIVIDRWWPSEAVYAKAFRGGSDWPMQGRMLDRIARKYGAIYVYCGSNPDTTIANHAKLKHTREEMYDDISDVAYLYDKLWNGDSTHENKGQYIDWAIRSGGIKYRPDCIDYNIDYWGSAMDVFIDKLKLLSDAWTGLQHEYISDSASNLTGHVQNASYIIVGSEPMSRFKTNWAFYDHSGLNLDITNKLTALNVKEESLIWANTFDYDGLPNMYVKGLLRDYPDLQLVTVGGATERKAFPNADHHLPNYNMPNIPAGPDYGRMMEVFKHA